MRDISNSPIFVRLGARLRGPKETTTVGAIRRVNISDIVVYNADPKYSSIISGIPGHSIEDLRLSNIRVYSKGGGTKEQAALDPPEKEDTYPEPTMFGDLPAYGFFIRHVKGLQMRDVEVSLPQRGFATCVLVKRRDGFRFSAHESTTCCQCTYVLDEECEQLSVCNNRGPSLRRD
jgi:hypothetical protein